MDWSTKELSSINLGDKRLNKRAVRILSKLCKDPVGSIPASCKGWEETKAAYRFFDHDRVTAEKLFKPHKESTLKRIKSHSVVLFVQDTSILSYTGQKQRKDIGPINRDSTRGLFIHPTLAVTPDRLCLGVIDNYQWARKELSGQTHKESSRSNHLRQSKDKESYRWVEGYRKANEYAQQLPNTLVVSVGDREADIYDIYHEAKLLDNVAHWLIRCSYDRCLADATGKRCHERLIATVKKAGAIGTLSFESSSLNKQSNRLIKQAIYTKQVNLNPPDRKKNRYGYQPVKATIIIATEQNPPKGEKALEWVLTTSLAVDNLERASELIQWYLCRWQIEIYFKILKSGCTIEKLSLTESKRFDACLALYMIIAWRILYVTMLGRECPNITCDCVFDLTEWQTAFIVFYKKKPPSQSPKLHEMIKIIASLGGFLNRKHDGEPGPQTMWLGMRNLHEHIKARFAFEDAFDHTYG